MTTKLDAALDHARRGWGVFPASEPGAGPTGCSCSRPDCQDPAKHPRIKGWQDAATTDAGTIKAWWTRWPNANIAIATGAASGIIVLDVDPRNGGNDSLRALEQEHGDLPRTPQAITGGGGEHHYFKHPGGTVPNSVNVAPGIDIRADGGLVIAPGSQHVSGGVYLWEVTAHPDDVELAEMPGWLMERLRQKRTAGSGPVPERIVKGSRNSTLASLGGSMRRRGMGRDEIFAALTAVNQQRCEPPLSDEEIGKIADSVSGYTPADTPISVNGKGPSGPPTPLAFPEIAWDDPFFSLYREAMSTFEGPDAHLFGSAATVLGWLFGRSISAIYARPIYPNFYTVLVGRTGATRKTESARRARDFALDVDPDTPYQAGTGSAEGLLEGLATAGMGEDERLQYLRHLTGIPTNEQGQPDAKGTIPELPRPPVEGRRLLLWQEEWAALLSKGRMDATGTLMPVVTELFDSPARVDPRTKGRRVIALKPTLSILSGSAPSWVEKGLTTSDMMSGFVNRFAFYIGEPKAPIALPQPPLAGPRSAALKIAHDAIESWGGQEHVFAFSPDAERAWTSYYVAHVSRLATYSDTYNAAVQRCPVFGLKLALIYAALRMGEPVLTGEDIERATAVAEYLEHGAGGLLGSLGETDTRDLRLEKRLCEVLAGREVLPKWKLRQAVSGRFTGIEVERVLDGLVKVGAVHKNSKGHYFDPQAARTEAKP